MSHTLNVLYRTRTFSFTLVLLIITTMVWLLLTDLMFRYPIGGMMLWYLKLKWGFWPAVDHGTRGLIGVYSVSKEAHWFTTMLGLLAFFATQVLFIRPGPGWAAALLKGGRPHMLRVVAAAFVAAGLTTGFVAMVLELAGCWSQLKGEPLAFDGFVFKPSFWIALPVLLGSWVFWSGLLAWCWRGDDRFMHMTRFLYQTFLAAGLLLLWAGLHEASQGFLGQYWVRGTFTSAEVAFAVMLWTLMPAVTLLYAAERYSRGKQGLCMSCGYAIAQQTAACGRCSR